MAQYDDRDPATQQVLRWFDAGHLPPGLQWVTAACAMLAQQMVDVIPDTPELTVGLRKLLESKDCFVRAAIEMHAVGGSAEVLMSFHQQRGEQMSVPGWHDIEIRVTNSATGVTDVWHYPMVEHLQVEVENLYSSSLPWEEDQPSIPEVTGSVVDLRFTARPDAEGTITEISVAEAEEE